MSAPAFNFPDRQQYDYRRVQPIMVATRGRHRDWQQTDEFELNSSAVGFSVTDIASSLARIQDHTPLVIVTREVTVGAMKRLVYFVGHEVRIDHKIEDFEDWFNRLTARGMRGGYFREVFTAQRSQLSRGYRSVVAWYSLDDHVFWTLDPDVANHLRRSRPLSLLVR